MDRSEQICDLRAKLAAATERADKAEGQLNGALAEFERLREVWKIRAEAAEAALISPRDGEARAVETLRKISEDADAHLNDNVLISNETRWKLRDIRACCDGAMSGPARDWLAQQRREAVAEALEDLADGELFHAEVSIKTTIRNRAAELRKGE